jgi:hypothetical protein
MHQYQCCVICPLLRVEWSCVRMRWLVLWFHFQVCSMHSLEVIPLMIFILVVHFIFFLSHSFFSDHFRGGPPPPPPPQEDMRDIIAPLALQHQWHSKLFGAKPSADHSALLHAAGSTASGDSKQDAAASSGAAVSSAASSSSSSAAASSSSASSSSAYFSADEAAVDLAAMLSLSSSSSSSSHALRTEPSGIGLSVHQLSALLLGSGLLIEVAYTLQLCCCCYRRHMKYCFFLV